MTSKCELKLVFFLSLCTITSPVFGSMTLEQVLKRAVETHPALQAAQYAELSQHQNEKVAQSAYYPNINAMGLATSGFPGSAGATGIEGLMVSPFHRGPSAGLVLEQNIWDFGR